MSEGFAKLLVDLARELGFVPTLLIFGTLFLGLVAKVASEIVASATVRRLGKTKALAEAWREISRLNDLNLTDKQKTLAAQTILRNFGVSDNTTNSFDGADNAFPNTIEKDDYEKFDREEELVLWSIAGGLSPGGMYIWWAIKNSLGPIGVKEIVFLAVITAISTLCGAGAVFNRDSYSKGAWSLYWRSFKYSAYTMMVFFFSAIFIQLL